MSLKAKHLKFFKIYSQSTIGILNDSPCIFLLIYITKIINKIPVNFLVNLGIFC